MYLVEGMLSVLELLAGSEGEEEEEEEVEGEEGVAAGSELRFQM